MCFTFESLGPIRDLKVLSCLIPAELAGSHTNHSLVAISRYFGGKQMK